MSAWGIGIMWGVKTPDDVALRQDASPYDEPGLLDQWEKLPRKTRGKAEVTASDGDGTCLGIWVALPDGHGSMDALNGVALDGMVDLPEVVKAKAAWTRFAAWAAGRGVALGEAKLWFAEVEYG